MSAVRKRNDQRGVFVSDPQRVLANRLCAFAPGRFWTPTVSLATHTSLLPYPSHRPAVSPAPSPPAGQLNRVEMRFALEFAQIAAVFLCYSCPAFVARVDGLARLLVDSFAPSSK